MKLKYLENYLLVGMAFVAAICIYLLYRPQDSTDGETQVIAKVIGQLNTVKRKKDFFQSWKDAYQGDGLSKNDEIYTHEKSFATIEFTNGNKVEISENSLIKIRNNKTNSYVELNKGNIVAELNKNQKNLEIEINGKKYNLISENAKIQIEQNTKENKFLVLEGSATIKSNKINTKLKNFEVLKEEIKSGKIETKTTSAILLHPKRRSIFYFDQSKTIHFEWNKLIDQENTIILSLDREFKNILSENKVSSNTFDFEFKSAQTIFWKVVSPDNSESPIFEFELRQYPIIDIRVNQTIFTKHQNIDEIAYITWDQIPNLKNVKYILNIRNPNNQVEEIITNRPNYSLPLKNTGEYKLKVRPFEKEYFQESKFGPMTILTLKNIDKFSIENLGPNEIEKIWYKKTKASTRINWNSNQKVDQYLIKIHKPDGKTETHQTTNQFFEVDHNLSGEYNWEVYGNIGETISNTISGKIIFKKPINVIQSPNKGAIVELQKPDQNINFKWETKENENFEYEIEISKDENFFNPTIKKVIKENTYSTALNQLGIYFWRVKILKGNKVEYSEPTSIELRPIPPLAKPDQLPDLKIKLKEENNSTFFKSIFKMLINNAYASEMTKKAEWTIPHNPKVKTYIIKIFSDSKGENLIKTIESNSSNFKWLDSRPGTYFWSMAYIDYFDRQTDFSKLSKMEIIDEIIITEKKLPLKADIEKKPLPTIVSKDANKITTKSEQPKITSALDAKKEAPINLKKLNYQFFYSPKLYSVEKSESNNIKINGVNFESIGFTKELEINFLNYDQFTYDVKFNRGKVFNKIIFNDFEFNFKAKSDLAFYKHGPSLFISKNSAFSVKNQVVTAANQFNAILVYLGEYQLGSINLMASIGHGTGLYLAFESNYHFNELYNLGFYFQSLENNNQVNQYLGLKFGYNFFK